MADSLPPIPVVLIMLVLLWGGFRTIRRYYADIKTGPSEERATQDRADEQGRQD